MVERERKIYSSIISKLIDLLFCFVCFVLGKQLSGKYGEVKIIAG